MTAVEMGTVNSPPQIQILEEIKPDHWESRGVNLDILKSKPEANFLVLLSNDFKKNAKKHMPEFKENFQDEFWPVLVDDINGSFHCEYSDSNARVTPAVTWSCFKVKEVESAGVYEWKQPAIHVDWNADTGRHVVHVFELPLWERDDFLPRIPSARERRCNPFSWHAAFARMILEQYDTAFWLLRDLVRKQEKERSESAHKLNDFPHLHDILRHLFHYEETIEVAQHTLRTMAAEQDRWRNEDEEDIRQNLGIWIKTRQRILHEEKRAHSLKTRSKSLNDRHRNEINLAFNLVSQSFGSDARTDSNMMKTVAIVSMVYLPGTFVSGLFGTNFFSFQADPGNTWLMADEFWLYWAVTLPLTFATVVIWAIWHWQDKLVILRTKAQGGESNKSAGSADSKGNLQSNYTPNNLLLRRVTTFLRGGGGVQRQETV
ncbi:uncharacterized protein BDW70DRAFT_89015 [Aspergillus foveolatus]|uniref:uncharacterized protein n=1 Tax=Aspergillus foveolatus TaxID=210207 RepID=UPI003CCD6770